MGMVENYQLETLELNTLYCKWAFTNYVDKMRQIAGTGKVNGMQAFPYKSKGLQISNVGRWSIMGKIQTTQFVNDP